MTEEQKQILKMVESGRITAEEGARLLKLVSDSPEMEPEPQHQARPMAAPEGQARREAAEPTWPQTRDYWLYPLWGGMALLMMGGVIAAATHQSRAGAWSLLCGWIPLCLGLVAVTVAAWVRTSRWIHLRVIDRHKHVAIDLPLPLDLGAFVIGVAREFSPRFRRTGVDEAILALRDAMGRDQSITVDVQGGEEGERIQIHVG